MLNNRPDTEFVSAVREIAERKRLTSPMDPVLSYNEMGEFFALLDVVLSHCKELRTQELSIVLVQNSLEFISVDGEEAKLYTKDYFKSGLSALESASIGDAIPSPYIYKDVYDKLAMTDVYGFDGTNEEFFRYAEHARVRTCSKDSSRDKRNWEIPVIKFSLFASRITSEDVKSIIKPGRPLSDVTCELYQAFEKNRIEPAVA